LLLFELVAYIPMMPMLLLPQQMLWHPFDSWLTARQVAHVQHGGLDLLTALLSSASVMGCLLWQRTIAAVH